MLTRIVNETKRKGLTLVNEYRNLKFSSLLERQKNHTIRSPQLKWKD